MERFKFSGTDLQADINSATAWQKIILYKAKDGTVGSYLKTARAGERILLLTTYGDQVWKYTKDCHRILSHDAFVLMRNGLGLSQEDLARLMGCDPERIDRYERGEEYSRMISTLMVYIVAAGKQIGYTFRAGPMMDWFGNPVNHFKLM